MNEKSVDEPPITLGEIRRFQALYVGSNMERCDIKKAYIKCRGNLKEMAAEIMFMDKNNCLRIKSIINQMIRSRELPNFPDALVSRQKDKRNKKVRKFVYYKGAGKLKKNKHDRRPNKSSRSKFVEDKGKVGSNDSLIHSTVSLMGEIVRGLFK